MRCTTIRRRLISGLVGVVGLACFLGGASRPACAAAGAPVVSEAAFSCQVRPVIQHYCIGCHSTQKHKGSLDLERFASLSLVRHDVKPWQTMVEQLESREMPPEGKPQPAESERAELIAWVRQFLNAEAVASAGDPGLVPLRRISNAEYNCIIRDLTGVDLQPARQFPADGAAGEGFTNAAEALVDMSPAMLGKYLLASKEIASHAVLLPDGFRFSPNKTRRDWSNESLAELRKFYARFTNDGKLPLRPYLAATLRHRRALLAGNQSVEDIAAAEHFNPKFLRHLWQTLTSDEPSFPLDQIRADWRRDAEGDSDALAAEIDAWQTQAWRVQPIGSYRFGNAVRQAPNDAAVADERRIRVGIKPAPGQTDVVLYLHARELFPGGKARYVIWRRPRLEGANKPALLLHGISPTTGPSATEPAAASGIDGRPFGVHPEGKPLDADSVAAPANSTLEVRLPAALANGREFAVEGILDADEGDGAEQFDVLQSPPVAPAPAPASPLVTRPDGPGRRRVADGLEKFRQCFPEFICFPNVIPVDEVVCLKMYHREDEPLIRLFLDDAQRKEIDRLWENHRFITQQPVAENEYLPLFIGFVTQDQSKEMIAYFESQREPFRRRAEDFQKEAEAAAPLQMQKLAEFASRAYRRPLSDSEKADLTALFAAFRAKGASGDEAFRSVLSRVLVAPSFLLHLEQPPGGAKPGPVNDWELATRLSLFLWSSVPDEELRSLAAAGRLHEPAVLAEQTRRMLADDRVRALAIEFGTQWIHVRGFDEFNEKSETLYPGFDKTLRAAMYEESILLFQNLFQHDRPAHEILDADYGYLNETLARYYGIPGIQGSGWRKVEGVRKFGRGGILALASVQAKQAGAARTSPVLRGNWVVEVLLGERLPRPPPDVPKLPDSESAADGLTMRQLVEKHTSVQSCNVCHQRIDPIGFAFERYDAIGRLREKESNGLPIDCRARTKDGAEFEGLDGLRNYLLAQKKDVILRLFCRRLAGYALNRAVTLSDQTLIDRMTEALGSSDAGLSAAVLEIVRSPQFQCIRGAACADDQ